MKPKPKKVALRSDEYRLKNALKNTPVILFEHDRHLRYTWVVNPNPKFGNTAEHIIGKTDDELLTRFCSGMYDMKIMFCPDGRK